MRIIWKVLVHICIICGLVCLTAKILDWYNPYMDFSGHILWVRFVLCMAVFAMTIIKCKDFGGYLCAKKNNRKNKVRN